MLRVGCHSIFTALAPAALIFIGTAETGFAEPPAKSEAEKLPRIQRLLLSAPPKVDMGSGVPEKQRAFCSAFLSDLEQASPHIKFIEPDVRTDDPHHPGLERYHSCDGYYRLGTGRDAPRNAYSSLEHDIGNYGYRLYRIHTKRTGPIELIYAEIANFETRGGVFPGFHMVDFDQCQVRLVYDSSELYGAGGTRLGENYNGLMQYRGGTYIFQLQSYAGYPSEVPSYRLDLIVLDPDAARDDYGCVAKHLNESTEPIPK